MTTEKKQDRQNWQHCPRCEGGLISPSDNRCNRCGLPPPPKAIVNNLTGEYVKCGDYGRVLFDDDSKPCGECLMFESEVSLNMSGVL